MEFIGIIVASTNGAILFHAYNWEEPEWLPRSQCAFEWPEHGGDEVVVKVARWLCRKNGWSETEEYKNAESDDSY